MQGNHVCDEGITTLVKDQLSSALETLAGRARLTPRRNHVKIEQRRQGAKEGTTSLQGFDPAKEGEHEEEDGNGFVIVRARNGPGDVSRNDANEGSGKKTSALIFQLFREPVSRKLRIVLFRRYVWSHMYVAQAVSALNPGASKTQMFRMSTGRCRA